jgi:hypothetical protein
MHPVLIYSILFIISTTSLLFVFEKYEYQSFYLLLIISSIITWFVGKILIGLIPSEDPMRDEIKKNDQKVRANQYQREIQFIFNVVQPDPKLQPKPKRVNESLEACFDLEAIEINKRLRFYFGDSFDTDTNQPLPDMVEEMKSKYNNWP